MDAPLLSVSALQKSFGGIVATDNVTLAVNIGEIHAIIGPNGAGKTTFISQLTGAVTPDAGTVCFKGRDITALPVYERAQLGLARSFQITSIIHEMTVLQNVALAVQARLGHSFRFWQPADKDPSLLEPARVALGQVGLDAVAHNVAGPMSHGEHRQLEIAIALATHPQLLLLDEPMAGLGPEETIKMVEIIRSVSTGKGVLLVEHDMDAVFALADRISVLVNGRLIATGSPDAIREDPKVIAAYLGDAH
jgi:branched-chain amino acid transport system ATP-binding protein